VGGYAEIEGIGREAMKKIGVLWLKEKPKDRENEMWHKFTLFSRVWVDNGEKFCSIQFSIKDNIISPDNFIEFMAKKGLSFKVRPVRYVKQDSYMIAFYKRVFLHVPIGKIQGCFDKMAKIKTEKMKAEIRVSSEDIIASEYAKII